MTLDDCPVKRRYVLEALATFAKLTEGLPNVVSLRSQHLKPPCNSDDVRDEEATLR